MLFKYSPSRSMVFFELAARPYEVLAIRRQVLWNRGALLLVDKKHELGKRFAVRPREHNSIPRMLPGGHFDDNAAQAPNVDASTVLLLEKQLRGHPKEGPRENT